MTFGDFVTRLRRVADGLHANLPTLPGIGPLFAPDEPLLDLGQEYAPPEEAECSAKIEELMRNKTLRDYPLGTRPVRRGAHAKHHGLCKAELVVDEEVPLELRQGLFAQPGARFAAWLRFSNAARQPQADDKMDGRGLAIKVRAADTATDSEGVQDFLLVNMANFFAHDAAEFLAFALFETDDRAANFFYSLLPPRLRLHALMSALAMTTQVIGSPFDATYHSGVPIAWGKDRRGNRRAVKLRVDRVGAPRAPSPDPNGDPYWRFRDVMEAELAQGEVVLRLSLQPQIDGRLTPIENPTLEWTEEEAPFIPCATLRIPRGDPFASHERMELGEVLSFNPWHHLPEHQPLGGINRVRRVVYGAMAALRWQLNDLRPPADLWQRWER